MCLPCAGPPGAESTALVQPTDARLQLLLQPHAGATVVALHTALLPLQISLPAVAALQHLAACLKDEESGQARGEAAGPHSTPPPLQAQDDLCALLFTYVASNSEAGHPQPLQVHATSAPQGASGGRGLSSLWGAGSSALAELEHVVAWAYSQPRSVAALLVEVRCGEPQPCNLCHATQLP